MSNFQKVSVKVRLFVRKKLRYVVKGGLMKQEYVIADSSCICTCTSMIPTWGDTVTRSFFLSPKIFYYSSL